jgi:hypothetical protein
MTEEDAKPRTNKFKTGSTRGARDDKANSV